MNNSSIVLSCQNLAKTYGEDKLYVEVLKEVNLQIASKERVAIVGSSGSGKSTLLHLLGGLDKPTTGEVNLDGFNIHTLSERKRCLLRNEKLGFIYQLHHLLPEFTVLENVCMPLLLRDIPKKEIVDRAQTILAKVGLAKRVEHKLGELSGGERQRTAIARALVTNPLCVLADEPTGNLDNKTAHSVYELMLELNQDYATSFIVVTHDMGLAGKMDRILYLENGVLGVSA